MILKNQILSSFVVPFRRVYTEIKASGHFGHRLALCDYHLGMWISSLEVLGGLQIHLFSKQESKAIPAFKERKCRVWTRAASTGGLTLGFLLVLLRVEFVRSLRPPPPKLTIRLQTKSGSDGSLTLYCQEVVLKMIDPRSFLVTSQ